MLSSLIPSHFISCSQKESLNFAVFKQKIHYSGNMPSFMIKIHQAAHTLFYFYKNPAADRGDCQRFASSSRCASSYLEPCSVEGFQSAGICAFGSPPPPLQGDPGETLGSCCSKASSLYISCFQFLKFAFILFLT